MSIWSIAMIYRRGFSAFGLQPIQTLSHAIGCNLSSELQSIPIIMSNFSVPELCTSLYICKKMFDKTQKEMIFTSNVFKHELNFSSSYDNLTQKKQKNQLKTLTKNIDKKRQISNSKLT